jgi:hypothetical protein
MGGLPSTFDDKVQNTEALEEHMVDFSREDWDEAAQITEGIWVVATRHNPGLAGGLEINNRTFVFRLKNPAGVEQLLAFGCGNATTITAIQKLEAETGLKLGWVVGNGGSHHLFLDLWYQAFPDARILVPGQRIPHTKNGKELAQKYADRWELMRGPKPKQLVEEFGDQIDCVIFDQLLANKEPDSKSGVAHDHRAKGVKLSGFGRLKLFTKISKDFSQPNDEVFFFHRDTGLVIAGHNFQFIYRPKGYKPLPRFRMQDGGFPLNIILKLLLPDGTFKSAFEGQPAPIADSKIHAAEWEAVLDWDIRHWTSCHNPPQVHGPDMSGDDIKAAVRASLARTGEDDPTGQRLKWNKKHGNQSPPGG